MQLKKITNSYPIIQSNSISTSTQILGQTNQMINDNQNSGKKKYLNKGQKNKQQNSLKGKWTQEQDKIYKEFLMLNRNKITSKSCRKNEKIYRQLSEALGHSRTPKQCRMHHLRMKRATRSISTIVSFLEKKHNKLISQKQGVKDSQIFVSTQAVAPEQQNKFGLNCEQFSVTVIKDSEMCIYISLDLSSIESW